MLELPRDPRRLPPHGISANPVLWISVQALPFLGILIQASVIVVISQGILPPTAHENLSQAPTFHPINKYHCVQVLFSSAVSMITSGHQLECVLRTVTKEGPNKGRQFYACPKPSVWMLTSYLTLPQNERCKMFQWADEEPSYSGGGNFSGGTNTFSNS